MKGLTLPLLPTTETNRRVGSCHIQGDSGGNVCALGGNGMGQFDKKKVHMNKCSDLELLLR